MYIKTFLHPFLRAHKFFILHLSVILIRISLFDDVFWNIWSFLIESSRYAMCWYHICYACLHIMLTDVRLFLFETFGIWITYVHNVHHSCLMMSWDNDLLGVSRHVRNESLKKSGSVNESIFFPLTNVYLLRQFRWKWDDAMDAGWAFSSHLLLLSF